MKRAIIFYHNDLDGNGAAALLYRYLKPKTNDIKLYEVDYNKNLPCYDKITNEDSVYFVDYSFNPSTYTNLRNVESLAHNVVWIDHHQSSIDIVETCPIVLPITSINEFTPRGIISKNGSGAYLTYLYIEFMKQMEEDGNTSFSYGFNRNMICDQINGQTFNNILSFVPDFVKYIDIYDRWQKDNELFENAVNFKTGMSLERINPLSNIWDILSNDQVLKLEVITGFGKLINRYNNKMNESLRASNGYESSYNGINCFVLNKIGNSDIFGDKFDKYPFMVAWMFDGSKYKYTLYSSGKHPKQVNCAKIAETYGGGGHRNAAGFVHDELIFKKV